MQLIIFANGILQDPEAEATRWVRAGDRVVAADGGTHHALRAGHPPTHVVGDLDSLPAEVRARLEEAGTELHPHPPAKDETDLELALLWAASQPDVDRIVVLGALGGRPDQTLANLSLLALPELAGHDVVIADGPWAIRCLRGGETVRIAGHPGDTLSLIPLGGPAQGITTQGLAYPLEDETLPVGPARGVSNVFEAEVVSIQLREGMLWCLHRQGRGQQEDE